MKVWMVIEQTNYSIRVVLITTNKKRAEALLDRPHHYISEHIVED